VSTQTLVIDANILVRAAMGSVAKALIHNNCVEVSFVVPRIALDDARKHLPGIVGKKGASDVEVSETLAVLDELVELMNVVEVDDFLEKFAEAMGRIGDRDPDDWPIVATALMLDCAIWTEDQDFFGIGVPTWVTRKLPLGLPVS
jgi:predicted nucleic acid-binding protein